MDLEVKKWHSLQGGKLYWDPQFIALEESYGLFESLREQIQWQRDNITLFGKTMPIPRLQSWYGDKRYRYSNLTMEPRPWLALLSDLKVRCEQVAMTNFNSVLANLYRDGNDSNGWHSDNEPELGEQPIIASLSFGETRKFHIKHKETKQKITFDLVSGSLLIMAGDMQRDWQHCVPKTKMPKSERINLTYRYIKPD
ncbi:alpha-ketoglutarate-dependent dioxygenase AlkB [Vibrio sp. Of7-15]|uniref:alpha-ketoglutarate-dependent dioxygenase AlkB family protein n=1 Tax=Vibrio sp. Of7-15 TaxID=2724879 RepID=UPI001EF3C059|nr:alpha-ketoglutarate-dependent dioxygenase AlkB [Vibrio sp. Of7-15]MCG7497845.1 alpha-ketoglutarate-dependent dioxygenase AlkB [Vibrio sp. Of7-15]